MCLALENWLFLTKNGFLLAMFFPRLYIVSNCSFFFFYLVSYICLYLFVCECAVYELLAIKYNYTLNPLDFFFHFFKPHSFYHHAHSRRGKEKSLIIKLIDFSAFFFFTFFCATYLVTRDNFTRGILFLSFTFI